MELWEIELFSELRPFLQDTLLPRQGNISVYLSVHSAGEKLIIPWGHTDKPYHDKENIVQLLQIGRLEKVKITTDY